MFIASADAHLGTCSLSLAPAAMTAEHCSLVQPRAVAADGTPLPKLERTRMDLFCPATARRFCTTPRSRSSPHSTTSPDRRAQHHRQIARVGAAGVGREQLVGHT